MTITIPAARYVDALRHIVIVTPGGAAANIAITHYRSNSFDPRNPRPNPNGGGSLPGQAFKDAVLNAFRRRGEPYPGFRRSLARAVNGKCGLEPLRKLLVALAMWIDEGGVRRLGRIDWPGPPPGANPWRRHRGVMLDQTMFMDLLRVTGHPVGDRLQLIADAFFGLDCNGFTGTWLQLNGVAGRNGDTWIPSFFEDRHAVTRLEEIRAPMIIRWGDNSHVNVIDAPGPSIGEWWVCGAEYGGIGRALYTIRPSVRGRFAVRGNHMSNANALIGPCEPPQRAPVRPHPP